MIFRPHESKPWNPWIAKVFHRRGLIETWGRGTLKIAGLMQEAGLQPPTVAVQGDCVMLTFRLACPRPPFLSWLNTLVNLGVPLSESSENCVKRGACSALVRPKAGTGKCYNKNSCSRLSHGGWEAFLLGKFFFTVSISRPS